MPDAVRAHWRAEAQRLGAPVLHQVLAARDPVMADRLRPSDPQRIVRALEVLEATGRSLGEWQAVPGAPLLAASATHRFCLRPDRAWLQSRCDTRFDHMVAGGALDEVRALAALELDPALPAMRALGVRPLLTHLSGRGTIEEATAAGKAETRQYVKRQETWLNSNMSSWIYVNMTFNYNINDICAFIMRDID